MNVPSPKTTTAGWVHQRSMRVDSPKRGRNAGSGRLLKVDPPEDRGILGAGARRVNACARSIVLQSPAVTSVGSPPQDLQHPRIPSGGNMKTLAVALLFVCSTAGLARAAASEPEWNMNATAIEACSCPMFCQCYFNVQPAAHSSMSHGSTAGMSGEDHFCKFNNAYLINKGKYGSTKLDGAKFWIYGDLGGDFSKGEMNWAVVTFDKATTTEQREAIGAIAGKLFPVQWKSLTTAEGDIEW